MKKIEKHLSLFIYFVSFALYLYLSIKSFFLVANTSNNLEFPNMVKANLLIVIIFALIYVLIIAVLTKLLSKFKNSPKWLLVIIMVWVFVISLVFINSAGVMIVSDQADVYVRACDIKTHIYKPASDWYFPTFPYQLGLMFFEKLIIVVQKEQDIIRLCTCIAISSSLIVLAGYKILKLINDDKRPLISYLLFMGTNAILIIYCSFIYNDTISIMFSLLSIWMCLKFIKEKKIVPFVLFIFFISLACIFRLTSLIVLIAEICVLLVKTICKKKIKNIVAVILSIIIPLLSIKLPKLYFNSVYHGQVKEGMPFNLTIAMSMQNDEYPGWYNDYNYSTYTFVANKDSKVAKNIANEYISSRLRYFSQHLNEMFIFYDKKISSQWFDGSYQCFTMTFDNQSEKGLLGTLVYYGNAHEILEQYMDIYQFVIYVLSFIYVVGVLKEYKKSHNINIEDNIINIIVIGGFLFSIIWESKGRYILPYYYCMIVIASIGTKYINKTIDKIKK